MRKPIFPKYSHSEYKKRGSIYDNGHEYNVLVESVGFPVVLMASASVYAADEYEAALTVLDWNPGDWDPDAWWHPETNASVSQWLERNRLPFTTPDDWRVTSVEKEP